MPKTTTVKVIVRHSVGCVDKKKGSDWRRCNCRKALLVYEGGGSGTNRRISVKTRSWEQAEREAAKYRDELDPTQQELRVLRAAKERQQCRIEDAVSLYTQDMITRLGDNGTVAMVRSLFGNVNPETKAITSRGKLFAWLDSLPLYDRPKVIAEFTPAHLADWRGSWKFGSDLTAANRWIMVKGFFAFCESQGWIEDSPARKLKPLQAAGGNRTAIFTDDEYTSIVAAVSLYQPENVPAATCKNWQRRLLAFLELARWSGMAIVDVVLYRPETIDAEGVLRYRRQKSGVMATVPLPDHVIKLLANLPLERDSAGAGMPFRSKGVVLMSDTAKWHRRLCEVFKLAGITTCRTGTGRQRPAHPHQLRDTFAVWHLRHGARLHTVSKMLGHAKTNTTERSYLPWVKELEESHIADARRSLAKIKS